MTGAAPPGLRVGVSAVIVHDEAILLVEFDDETGPHFNLPGGGVEPGESLHDALRREVREETGAEVTVGRLLLVWEYVPAHYDYRYGAQQKLGLLFACTLLPGSTPHLPTTPDPNQVAVRWLPLAELPTAPLLPRISDRIIAALHTPPTGDPFCEHI
jgi:8-oxo-dGTP diphosphatase